MINYITKMSPHTFGHLHEFTKWPFQFMDKKSALIFDEYHYSEFRK